MKQSLYIDIYFDFICPWCWIGKRNLEPALASLKASHPQVEVIRQWHGVQLLPDLPLAGIPYKEFYLRRLGSEAAIRQRQAQVQEAARYAGLALALAGIPRMPNTGEAHRLFRACSQLQSEPKQLDALLEKLFALHFIQYNDLSDTDLLLAIAGECGFDAGAVADRLANPGTHRSPNHRVAASVPSFVFNAGFDFHQNRLISGAQPPNVLHQAMVQAVAGEVRA